MDPYLDPAGEFVGVHGSWGRTRPIAASSDNGASWTTQLVSAVPQMPQYEMFGDRDLPFHGDYNYVSAADGLVFVAWADTRDVVAGTDPRYPVDGADGFDVLRSGARDTLIVATRPFSERRDVVPPLSMGSGLEVCRIGRLVYSADSISRRPRTAPRGRSLFP